MSELTCDSSVEWLFLHVLLKKALWSVLNTCTRPSALGLTCEGFGKKAAAPVCQGIKKLELSISQRKCGSMFLLSPWKAANQWQEL